LQWYFTGHCNNRDIFFLCPHRYPIRPLSIGAIGDNEVAAFGNMVTTSKATGKQISLDWAMHWKFNEEGKVVYFQDFLDTAAAHMANQKG